MYAKREWGRQWMLPQDSRWQDAETGRESRYHLNPSVVQKAVKQAVLKA
jgi:hypothetical protein